MKWQNEWFVNYFSFNSPSEFTFWITYVLRTGDLEMHTKISVRKPEGRGLLRRTRRRWEDIKRGCKVVKTAHGGI
jgi:hypothetical protein